MRLYDRDKFGHIFIVRDLRRVSLANGESAIVDEETGEVTGTDAELKSSVPLRRIPYPSNKAERIAAAKQRLANPDEYDRYWSQPKQTVAVDIPFKPFTVAELNRPNPLMDAAYAESIRQAESSGDRDGYAMVADIDSPVTQSVPNVALPSGYDWYYDGNAMAVGRDEHRHDFMFDKGTRRIQRITSANEQKRICAYAKRYGDKKASVLYGVNRATVRSWMLRKRKAAPKVIEVPYYGYCPICHGCIHPGERVIDNPPAIWNHVKCSARRSETRRPETLELAA